MHVLFCSILCHNLQLWRTLNTTNATPASLPLYCLQALKSAESPTSVHFITSLQVSANARFSVLTDNESIFLTNNKLFNASTLADCVYFINPHLFKLQKNAHRNIKRLEVIIKDKAVNTTTSNSILSVSVVV